MKIDEEIAHPGWVDMSGPDVIVLGGVNEHNDVSPVRLKDGMLCHTHIYDDAYWIRVFAGNIMAGLICAAADHGVSFPELPEHSILFAKKLLEEIKKREKEK